MGNKFKTNGSTESTLVSITRPPSVCIDLLDAGDMVEIWTWKDLTAFCKIDSEGNVMQYKTSTMIDDDDSDIMHWVKPYSIFRGLIVRKEHELHHCIDVLEPEIGIIRIFMVENKKDIYTVYKITKEDYEEEL